MPLGLHYPESGDHNALAMVLSIRPSTEQAQTRAAGSQHIGTVELLVTLSWWFVLLEQLFLVAFAYHGFTAKKVQVDGLHEGCQFGDANPWMQAFITERAWIGSSFSYSWDFMFMSIICFHSNSKKQCSDREGVRLEPAGVDPSWSEPCGSSTEQQRHPRSVVICHCFTPYIDFVKESVSALFAAGWPQLTVVRREPLECLTTNKC